MALTGRFALLVLLGVLPALWSVTALLWYVAVVVALAVVDVALAVPVGRLGITRDRVAPVRLHESTGTTLVVHNTGRRTAHGRLRDAWVPSAGATVRDHALRVPPGERRVLLTPLVPQRRGERHAAAVTVRSEGPLGVAARQRSVRVPGTLQVLPAFASRRFLPEKLSRLRRLDGAVLVRQRGQGSEFDALRTYVAGDDVRAIDWRATARSRETVVRTWRPERDRHIVIAVDTGRGSAARLGDEPRLDSALDAALLLGALAARAGDRVALVAADVRVRARTGPVGGHDVLPRLVAGLAPLEPSLVETDPQLLAAQVLRQVSRRSLVVLFSSLDTAADTGLLPAVRTLATRHLVLVASPADPTLAALATGGGDADSVYAAAAAELALARRVAVVEQLTVLGAVVVDAGADHFAPAVADAYLDLKAAGRL